MRGYRKLFMGCFGIVSYIVGAILTGVQVEGGIFVSMVLITIGGNVGAAVANGKKTVADV